MRVNRASPILRAELVKRPVQLGSTVTVTSVTDTRR